MDRADANRLQVMAELQADCLAGVWANHSQQKRKFLDPADVEAGLDTASAIGDDRLQRRTQGYAVPDAFTHGSSRQRVRWFITGLKSGEIGKLRHVQCRATLRRQLRTSTLEMRSSDINPKSSQ